MTEQKSPTCTAILVDQENNAEVWWEELRSVYPQIAAELSRRQHAVVTEEVYNLLASLPGFADGPDYAPTALIHAGNSGDLYGEVVSSAHRVFDTAQ